MKTAEEILNKRGVTIGAMRYNSDNAYKAVCNIIEQVQKEAYNQAIEDVAKYSIDRNPDGVVIHDGIDSESILRLKK